jgi:hypothetical protein
MDEKAAADKDKNERRCIVKTSTTITRFAKLYSRRLPARRENVLLLGNSANVETHIALTLGLAACQQGYRIRFTTAAPLVHPRPSYGWQTTWAMEKWKAKNASHFSTPPTAAI